MIAFVLLATSCAEYGPEDFVVTECASDEDFSTHVSPLLERRCGTLDCHGVEARPLRIYGQLGLRFEEEEAGGAATTDEEKRRNWLASCGLEPELTHRVTIGEADPDELALVRKPLKIVAGEEEVSGERHKGGPVLERGAAGYQCLVSWLRGFTDVARCKEASTAVR